MIRASGMTKCTGAILKGEVIVSAVDMTVNDVPFFLIEHINEHIIINNADNVVEFEMKDGEIFNVRNESYLLGDFGIVLSIKN